MDEEFDEGVVDTAGEPTVPRVTDTGFGVHLGADDDVGVLSAQDVKEVGKGLWGKVKVGIEQEDVIPFGVAEAVAKRLALAAVNGKQDGDNRGKLGGSAGNLRGSVVCGTVVNDNKLKRDVRVKGGVEAAQILRNDGTKVIGGKHNRKKTVLSEAFPCSIP